MDADFSHQPKYLPALSGRHGPARRTAGRRDDRLALHSRRRRGGLAVEAAADEPGGESLRPLAARAADRRIAAGRSAAIARKCWPGSISTPIRSRGYSFQEEILWRLKRLGARFGETPIVFVERQRGRVENPRRRSRGGAADHFRAWGCKIGWAIRKCPLSLWERVRVRAGEVRTPSANRPHPRPLSQRERGDNAVLARPRGTSSSSGTGCGSA